MKRAAQALIALLRDKGFTGECLNVVYEPVTGAHVGRERWRCSSTEQKSEHKGAPEGKPSGAFYMVDFAQKV